MTIFKERSRTSSKYVYYALQLYSSGLSLRKTSERLTAVRIKRNHVSIWNWIQRYKPKRIFQARRTISEFIIDETLIKRYGKHNISTDGGTWYPQACRFLNIEQHNHSSIEKSFIERTIQYIKDRTECFDDYFPCTRINCKLEHIVKWLILFVDMHNRELIIKRRIVK